MNHDKPLREPALDRSPHMPPGVTLDDIDPHPCGRLPWIRPGRLPRTALFPKLPRQPEQEPAK